MMLGDALTVPLPCDLVPCVAVAPGVVVHGFMGVDHHVRLGSGAAVQPRDGVDDVLVLLLDLERLFWVGVVVDARLAVARRVVVTGEGLDVWTDFVLVLELLAYGMGG